MELKELRYFVHVAELGSFAKAADVLDVAQPTLSRQVRALEVELGASLFHRTGRGVMLTPEGARFLDQARGVLHAAEAAVQVLHGGNRRLTGKVVCGLTPSIGRIMIPELVRRFRERLPGASLSVVNLLSVSLHDYLRAGRLDFAIMHRPLPSRELSITSLRTEDLHLVGARSHDRRPSVPLRELEGLALAMPSPLHLVRRQLETEAARAGMALNIVLEVDVLESLFEVVAGGVGHTVSTKYPLLSPATPRNLMAQRIVSPSLSTEICLVTPTTRTMTPLQLAAAELARDTFDDLAAQELPAWLRPGTSDRGARSVKKKK